MSDKRRTRIEEDSEHNRQHTIWHNIHTAPRMFNNNICNHGEEERQSHDKQNGAQAVEIVATELLEVHHHQDNQNGYIEYAAANTEHPH